MLEIESAMEKVLDLFESIPNKYEYIAQKTPYYNMGATLTDAVLQAGMNYKNVVYPRVYNILTKFSEFTTTCDFIILFQTIPIERIMQWKNINKQETVCKLAWFLYDMKIQTEDDLAKWLEIDENSEALLKIKGVGLKTVDYLKLLAGLQAIPIDRHMFQFLALAGVVTSSYKEASRILRETAKQLKIGESVLDKTIWNYMSKMDKNNNFQSSLFD